MPMFIAVHKWKPQDDITIMKELVAGFTAMQEGKIPKDVKLDATYCLAQGSYCVWEAASKEALEKTFDKFLPTLKKNTEFVPVVQSYPPTMDCIVSLWQQMIKAASK